MSLTMKSAATSSALSELARTVSDAYRGLIRSDDYLDIVLAWLLVGQVCNAGKEMPQVYPTLRHALESESAWSGLVESDQMPQQAYASVWQEVGHNKQTAWDRIRTCAAAVSKYVESGSNADDPLDVASVLADTQRAAYQYGSIFVRPHIADLMTQLSLVSGGQEVVCPEDTSGQFATLSGRCGAKVLVPAHNAKAVLRTELLQRLDAINGIKWSFQTFASYSEIMGQTPYVLGWVPFGVRALDPVKQYGPDVYKHVSDINKNTPFEVVALKFYRALSDGNMTVIVPPIFLSGRGQTQQLRSELVREKAVRSVTMLPAKSLATTQLAPALMQLAAEPTDRITLTDMERGEYDLETADDDLSRRQRLQDAVTIIAGGRTTSFSRVIHSSDISQSDYSLVPSRYLVTVEIEHAVRLGELVTFIRSPASSKRVGAVSAIELGIPELSYKTWRPTTHADKMRDINPEKLLKGTLQPGDVVLSIKGTVGKSGIVGAWAEDDDTPRIVSNSCVALRLNRGDDRLIPEYLFMFLRTQMAQRQMDALAGGATIKQLNPSVLAAEFQVPVPPLAVQNKYKSMLAALQSRESELAKQWQSLDDKSTDTLSMLERGA